MCFASRRPPLDTSGGGLMHLVFSLMSCAAARGCAPCARAREAARARGPRGACRRVRAYTEASVTTVLDSHVCTLKIYTWHARHDLRRREHRSDYVLAERSGGSGADDGSDAATSTAATAAKVTPSQSRKRWRSTSDTASSSGSKPQCFGERTVHSAWTPRGAARARA